MTELALRIIFAVVAIPITLFVVLYGGVTFRIFITAFLLGAGVEFYRMTREKGMAIFLPATLLGILMFCGRASSLTTSVEKVFFPVLALSIVLMMAYEVLQANPEKFFVRTGATLLSIFYAGFLGSYLILITELPVQLDASAKLPFQGIAVMCLLISVWSSDTLAFFAGKKFGKHPLLPKASPKKTVEGLLGAMVGGALGLAAASSVFKLTILSIPSALLIGLFIGLFGQMGDLFESLIKRACGVKDSSNILPGHGGMLDRIDALIFTAPVYYYAILWFILP